MIKFENWDYDEAVEQVARYISSPLVAGQRVTWFTSGGSNIMIQKDIMDVVATEAKDHVRLLTIAPVDERYGLKDHEDSNYRAMKQVGFQPGAAQWIDVLDKDADFATTTNMYKDVVEEAVQADVTIATLGLGADGHTAGILPRSSALDADDTVVGYQANFQRMTLTPKALINIDHAFLIAYGASKLGAVNELKENKQTLANMPAKIIYDMKQVTVLSDKGGNQ